MKKHSCINHLSPYTSAMNNFLITFALLWLLPTPAFSQQEGDPTGFCPASHSTQNSGLGGDPAGTIVIFMTEMNGECPEGRGCSWSYDIFFYNLPMPNTTVYCNGVAGTPFGNANNFEFLGQTVSIGCNELEGFVNRRYVVRKTGHPFGARKGGVALKLICGECTV